MEYATREQAQQAVNTLSNQNLMGRLVYVREVRLTSLMTPYSLCKTDMISRIAKPNLVLQGLQLEVAADTKVDLVVDLEVDSAVVEWVLAPVPAAVVVKSTSPTFVSDPLFPFLT